jgi:hypothetical protein
VLRATLNTITAVMTLACVALLAPSIFASVDDYQRAASIKERAYARHFVLYGARPGQFSQLPQEILGRPGAAVLNEKKEELGCVQADSKTIGACQWWRKETNTKPQKTQDLEVFPVPRPEKLHGFSLFDG